MLWFLFVTLLVHLKCFYSTIQLIIFLYLSFLDLNNKSSEIGLETNQWYVLQPNFLITKSITSHSIWVNLFFGLLLVSLPALIMTNQEYLSVAKLLTVWSVTLSPACCELFWLEPTLLTDWSQLYTWSLHALMTWSVILHTKNAGSNVNDWLKYPIILFDEVLPSFVVVVVHYHFLSSSFSGGHFSTVWETPNMEWLPAILCL